MNAVDGSEHYERSSDVSTPSLLTIILDTNPAAWNVLADYLSLSDAVSDLLIFINAHLACNYANKVAVIASHCTTAKWLYPTPLIQAGPASNQASKRKASQAANDRDGEADGSKKPKVEDSNETPLKLKLKLKEPKSGVNSNKYRPFRLVEEEVIKNLSDLLASTTESEVSKTTSTMIAGALTLALSYINREMITYAEENGGGGNRANATDPTSEPTTGGINPSSTSSSTLQSRILLLSVSPSTDLAHQYIPIMNSIFACQRLSIPIDICQIPLPVPSSTTTTLKAAQSTLPPTSSTTPTNSSSTSTVFLQQASDATHGIYIPLPPHPPAGGPSSSTTPSWSLLQYLLFSFLPSPHTRQLLVLPTRIDVDFRAACFCHRRVVDIGFVCSICLSIFCSIPEGNECLTCGTGLSLGEYGARPLVVAPKRKKKKRVAPGGGGSLEGTPAGTPVP